MNPRLERFSNHLRDLNEGGIAETPAAILILANAVVEVIRGAGAGDITSAIGEARDAIAAALKDKR
jgi:hypothetical protein